MVLVLGIPMDIAVGSSALMVGVTASGGFAGHLLNEHWDWRISLILAIAVFVGGQIGSRFTIKLDKTRLKKGFGWFLLVIAGTMGCSKTSFNFDTNDKKFNGRKGENIMS